MTDDGSAIAVSEMDDHPMAYASSPIHADSNPRASIQHVLENSDSRRNTPPATKTGDLTEDDEARTPGSTAQLGLAAPTSRKKKEKEAPPVTAQNSSIYSGNKVRHLKKDDGEPLWRADIQYDFLRHVFEDDKEVFTNSYEPGTIGLQTFADLYIDAMARSSKTSKILRDKLLSEHEPAKNMAMVCLLVNLGRMNTTLNFFPEMRAQLRTYHAIPSLQARQDPNSYKQLQDAPRLKSILKGASEDRPEPSTLEKVKLVEGPPRTNPVNLIFVLAQVAPKITTLHLPPGHDFYDLVMRTDISSKSRARAFLWLMWFYLESDFTEEGAEENPFGPGVDYQVNVRNQGVPNFDYLTPDEEAKENIDTQEEKEYGISKMKERKRIIEADQAAFQAENGPPKRGPKPRLHLPQDERGHSPAGLLGRIRPKHDEASASPASIIGRIRPKYESDLDSTRSTPPPRAIASSIRGNSGLSAAKGRDSNKTQAVEGSSPVAPPGEVIMTRARPLTAHQLAVERNRNQRVDHILGRGLRKAHHHARKIRRQEGAFHRALMRSQYIDDTFDDSEADDALAKGPGRFKTRGLVGLVQLEDEEDDFGEEMAAYAAAFRRTGRRLDRWGKGKILGVVGTNRVPPSKPPAVNGHEEEDERPIRATRKRKSNGKAAKRARDIDDVEKEILAAASDEGGPDDLDDVDKEILALGGEDTEEDGSEGAMDVDSEL